MVYMMEKQKITKKKEKDYFIGKMVIFFLENGKMMK